MFYRFSMSNGIILLHLYPNKIGPVSTIEGVAVDSYDRDRLEYIKLPIYVRV